LRIQLVHTNKLYFFLSDIFVSKNIFPVKYKVPITRSS